MAEKTRRLTITTIRDLDDDEWREYQSVMTQAGLNLDWKKLESRGKLTFAETCRDDEQVVTTYEIERTKPHE
jgi:hypothetical protein